MLANVLIEVWRKPRLYLTPLDNLIIGVECVVVFGALWGIAYLFMRK
ncbi:MAG TPA: hypothetical protein VEA69_16750 [Tepidisphaeraceae bacterium]|nr:hypothetical protein [Tepidisphaeraceae bacterium]